MYASVMFLHTEIKYSEVKGERRVKVITQTCMHAKESPQYWKMMSHYKYGEKIADRAREAGGGGGGRKGGRVESVE